MMVNPVVAADGHTYERAAIHELMMRSYTSRSPMTREVFKHHDLTPNFNLKSMLADWVAEGPGRLQRDVPSYSPSSYQTPQSKMLLPVVRPIVYDVASSPEVGLLLFFFDTCLYFFLIEISF
jgi:hypothetical protein